MVNTQKGKVFKAQILAEIMSKSQTCKNCCGKHTEEEKYDGWLISPNFFKRLSAIAGYVLLAILLFYTSVFILGFIVGILFG